MGNQRIHRGTNIGQHADPLEHVSAILRFHPPAFTVSCKALWHAVLSRMLLHVLSHRNQIL